MGTVEASKALSMTSENKPWDPCIQSAVVSDVGMRRTSNQDTFAVLPAADLQNWRKRGHLFLVADGMGAHAGGELASKLAADGIPQSYYIHCNKPASAAIRLALTETNAQIHRRGLANIDFHNMGTTASALLLLPEGALVGHVGDSRVYRLRKNQLEQITFDHSLLWEIQATGKFPSDTNLESVVPKNVITRSLGPNPSVEVDLEGPLPIELGDTGGDSGLVWDARFDAVAAAIEIERQELGAPCIAVAIIEGGQITFSAGFGSRDAEDDAGQRPNGNTLFRMGSVNKMLTATHVMQQVEAGTLSLADPITDP